MRSYRIGDARGDYPVYSGEGAKLFPGRWNALGQDMIYASEHYSTAILEKLVRTGAMPPNQHFVEIAAPSGTSYEVATKDTVPDWSAANRETARAFGAAWFDQGRSAILIVPSVVARMENNILINPHHPDSARIVIGLETPIWWDERLFA
jgi:RES domain-containing protein